MLTFRNTNIFFGVLLITILILDVWFNMPVYLYLIGALIYCLLLFYGSYHVGSNFFVKVICSADTPQRVVAISFDDGPLDNYTPQVLQVLKEHRVPAAFFCIGRNIAKNKSLFRQVHEEGHIIGNHSYIHTPLFDFFPAKKMLEDVRMTDIAIRNSIGVQPKLFRPPYGITTPAMKKVMAIGGYTVVGWNIRSFDTMASNEEKLLKKLIRLLRPGAVILLHDTQQITLSILPRFIQSARNEGYEFVRLDKLLNVQAYA